MTEREPIETTNLDDRYGSDALPWSRPDVHLAGGPYGPEMSFFLGTVRPDGRPHSAAVGAVYDGGDLYFTNTPTLERLAARYRDGGWPAQVEGDAFTAPFSAPSAGPPPWQLYRFRFDRAFGVATSEPWGATRWSFATR
jgi:hypothetical protein